MQGRDIYQVIGSFDSYKDKGLESTIKSKSNISDDTKFWMEIYDGNKLKLKIHRNFVGEDFVSMSCLLSQFPGNCSTLVIHNIQHLITISKRREEDPSTNLIKLAESFASITGYRALFISVSDIGFLEPLSDLGYKEMLSDVFNYHSSRKNFFLYKLIDFDGSFFDDR